MKTKNLILLKRCIAYARREIHLKLTTEASKVLQEFYITIKSEAEAEDFPVPITSQLEALIKLSEASAKTRLGDEVTAFDVRKAIEIQQKCMKQMGYDPETGKVDIGKFEGRKPKSDSENLRIVTKVMGELEYGYNGKTPKTILIYELEDRYNMSERKTEDIIKMLKRKRTIYEPSTGYYKVS